MGFFSTPSGSTSAPSPDPKAKTAPNRNQRRACWEGRDAFFGCLDAHGIVDSIKEGDKAKKECAPELARFEKDCVASWVEYFKKRRVMEHNREQMLENLKKEGAKEIGSSIPAAQTGAK